MDANFNEMDANMFNQYMYKANDDNLNVSLSVPQYSTSGQQQQPVNQSYHEMNDQTFHTPSFGDEEFDIPVMHHQPQTQHHDLDQFNQIQMGLITDQQSTFDQWHQQTASESHMMTSQTYQPDASNYHHMSSPSQQMIMMQAPPHQPLPIQHHQQQPQMSPQMNAAGNNYIGQSPSQALHSGENGSTTDDSDDNGLNADPTMAFKHPSPDPFVDADSPKGSGAKKVKAAAKKAPKKRKDPNEPQKPVSAYALFFRDTQAAIKGQNPNASFGEVSKIVASMWDVLAPEHKNVYKKKTETAKKDYLKALAAYRASLVCQGSEEAQPSAQQGNHQASAGLVPPQQQQIQSTVNAHQMQSFPQISQSYQQSFVNQSMMTQNMMQTQNSIMTVTQQQQPTQNQYMNQQMHQMNQPAQQAQQQPIQPPPQQNIPPQQVIPNNNQLPPVPNNAANAPQNCIRIGCTNPAIVSNDWEDEYCSYECVITHCRDVFGNWVHTQSGTQQQTFVAN